MSYLKTWFGLRSIAGRIRRMPRRARAVREVRAQGSWEAMAKYLQNRARLVAVLDAPVLLQDAEIALLARYAAGAKKTVVEIGAAYGGSSLIMLTHLQGGARLYSLDPFIQDSMGQFQATESTCRRCVKNAIVALGDPKRTEQWTLIPQYSFDVMKTWAQKIDMIFIDGDHAYESVKKDFEDWLSFVERGGYMLFHDSRRREGTPDGSYDKGWPGPTRLVNELMSDSRVEFIESAESLSVFRKVA